MNEKYLELKSFIPKDTSIDWSSIENSFLNSSIIDLKNTPQNPYYHGEGDVWTHTKLVAEALVNLSDYKEADRRKQEILFLSALFHDIGKPSTTKFVDGKWTSPFHANRGSKMMRELFWKELGASGSSELRNLRETIALLIKYHSLPIYIFERENPELVISRIAANQNLLPDFSLEMLATLVEADMIGRETKVKKESLENLELFRILAKDYKCYKNPIQFPNDFSEYSFLNGTKIMPGQDLYNDTWGEIVLLSGLPASGKDTWINNFGKDRPIISLDDIRHELGISPRDNQSKVITVANERAKEFLRSHTPFIWNATNLTPDIRKKQLRLFNQYNAATRLVYLETHLEDLFERNNKRDRTVPTTVINNMVSKIIPPERFEAHSVEWIAS